MPGQELNVEDDAVIEKRSTYTTEQKSFPIDTTKLSPMIQDIRDKLDDHVIGQEDAKDKIVDTLSRTLVPNPNRKGTIANLMFLGPTGVGKTEIVRALYRILFGDPYIDIGSCKVDAADYSSSVSMSDLLGASPNFVGREQTPILSGKNIFKEYYKAKARRTLHPALDSFEDFGILLIDEIEKGSHELHNTLLSIMDEGIINLKNGAETEADIGKKVSGGVELTWLKTTNFKNVMIILTSNIGAEEIQSKMEGKGTAGFQTEKTLNEDLFSEKYYKDMVKKSNIFKPEFLGRLSYFIPFKPLTREEFYQRVELSTRQLEKTYEDKGIKLILTGKAKTHIVDESIESNEGGRKLVNLFKNEIETQYQRVVNNNGEIDTIA